MVWILFGISIVLLVFIIILLFILNKKQQSNILKNSVDEIKREMLKFGVALEKNESILKDEFQRSRIESLSQAKNNREELSKSLESFSKSFSDEIIGFKTMLKEYFSDFAKNQSEINKMLTEQTKDLRNSIENSLKLIREDNDKQLMEMRKTVDEKLQTTLEKRLGESFKQVSERLELVHKGLGEMQTIANGVGDLKKVLSNVKTRGVFGEYQLANILEQLLTSDQYAKNVATKHGSQANVEFAIKLPGKDKDEPVWLPVDSKFSIEPYERLNNSYEIADKFQIEKYRKELLKSIEGFAKTISDKYLDPPFTTDFAIMFLPIEGLYAEILKEPGFFETLQRKYRITATGPTTLSALLNSLQMGFRTLAVQKRSSEVWKILEAVKTEFGKFEKQLEIVDKQLETASKSLQSLKTTRTNQIVRKLRTVATMDSKDAENLLELK